jgi:hypothetical protein
MEFEINTIKEYGVISLKIFNSRAMIGSILQINTLSNVYLICFHI